MSGVNNIILVCARHFCGEVVMGLVFSGGLNNLNFSLIFSNRDDHSLLLVRFTTTLLEQDFYERTSSWYVPLYGQGPVCHNWRSYLSNRFLTRKNLQTYSSYHPLVFVLLLTVMLDEFFWTYSRALQMQKKSPHTK